MYYWDASFNEDFNNLRKFDNVVYDLSCISIFNNFNRLFNYSVERFNYLYNSLDNLFPNYFNFDHLLNDLFDNHNFLFDYFNFSNLRDSVVNNPFNINWLLNLDNPLHNDLDFNDFWYFNDSFNNSLDNSWNLNDLFSETLNLDNLLNDYVNVFNDLNGYVNDSFNLLNSDNFDWFLNNSFNGDDLGNLDYSFNYLFDNFFNLNNLRNNSEDL